MGDPFQPGGLRLSDGSRIGGWSMDVIDGKRDDSLAPDAPSEQPGVDPVADSFANRMMENLFYQKIKATQKAEAAAAKAAAGKSKSKSKLPGVAQKAASPVPLAPADPEDTSRERGPADPEDTSRERGPSRSSRSPERDARRRSRSVDREEQRHRHSDGDGKDVAEDGIYVLQ